MQPLLGGTPAEVPDRYKAASPITYIGGNDSPVLTICGTLDPSLPEQKLLDERMRQAGSTHTLLVVEGARHSMSGLVSFYMDDPIWNFFDKHLKAGK